MRQLYLAIRGLLLIGLMAWSPWVNEQFVENRINAIGNNYEVFFFEKIPFGARSILYYTTTGRVDGIREKAFSLEYTSFIGMRKVIYDEDLEKIKPKTEVILEQKIIDRIKEKYPEVKNINKPNTVGIGTGQSIYGELWDADYIITFWNGWSDCPSGCITNHWWYFEVKGNGDINKIGERGNPITGWAT